MLSGNFQKTQLENGLRIVTEQVPYVRSISLGVWIEVGSRDEQKEEQGISHFLEHMLFKGTVHRNGFEIVHSLESLGGGLDGFTSRDLTCYYARCLDEHAPVAIEVLGDMLQYSRLDPDEIEKEKRVVLEEIQSVEDTPDDWIHDLFAKSVWGTHPIAEPIQGTPQYVVEFTRERLCRYLEMHYVPERIV
ncbi:MAG: pitrilysin family protein, partial [bacterium]|nr:pitrilysin family protein [bacterium]